MLNFNPLDARSRYTDFAQFPTPPECGIPSARYVTAGTRPATRQRRRLVTNETTATGGIMYTDEGELEFDEDEMAALEGQRSFADFRCGNY